MAFSIDAEILGILSMVGDAMVMEPVARGDWKALRASTDGMNAVLAPLSPTYEDVERMSYTIPTNDGAEIEVRWYRKVGSDAQAAVVFAHGGGRLAGSIDAHDSYVAGFVSASGVPMLSVGYRLAPEYQGSIAAQDMFAAVLWLAEHAEQLGIDPARIAVMGDSSGGGIAASTAILARDKGFALAGQLLAYPMLDDRNIEPDQQLAPLVALAWSYDSNYTGWQAVLGDNVAGEDVSCLVAPARNCNYEGLPPAYIMVGEVDLFRDESVAYAQRLWAAGVSCELHVYSGCVHGFDRFPIKAASSAFQDVMRMLQKL